MSDIETMQEEISLQRDRYHKLSGVVNVVTGNMEILKDSMEKLSNVSTEVSVLSAQVKTWMDTTTEYRTSLCGKLDRLSRSFELLPCTERKAWYSLTNKTLWALWTVIVGMLFIGVKHLGWK